MCACDKCGIFIFHLYVYVHTRKWEKKEFLFVS